MDINENSKQPKILCKRIDPKTIIPKRSNPTSAGLDLYSNKREVIPAHERRLIHTGLKLAIPPYHYGRIAPRSGISLNHSIDIGAGVIDSDYRGEIKILMINHGNSDYEIQEGDRIAQLICEKIALADIEEVMGDNLGQTERNESGFGSSGR